MKSVSGKHLSKILEHKGWLKISSKGSHFKYRLGSKTVIVPVHGNQDIPIGTLKGLMRDANLTKEDLL